jgi:cob(I)alamin adenosyltransferase
MALLGSLNCEPDHDGLDIAEAAAFGCAENPPIPHVVPTGRNATPDLLELADAAVEKALVKP